MIAELFFVGKSLEMATREPGALQMLVLGEVVCPAAETEAMLTTMAWVIVLVLQELMRRFKISGTVRALGWYWSRNWPWGGSSDDRGNVDEWHFTRCQMAELVVDDRRSCGQS